VTNLYLFYLKNKNLFINKKQESTTMAKPLIHWGASNCENIYHRGFATLLHLPPLNELNHDTTDTLFIK